VSESPSSISQKIPASIIVFVFMLGCFSVLRCLALTRAFFSASSSPYILITLPFAIACVFASIGILRHNKLAWGVAVASVLLDLIYQIVFFYINVNAYLSDDPLYLDSPGTIYIVYITTALNLPLILIMLGIIVFKRAYILAELRRQE
jgi:hypothetical protein